MNSLKLWPSLLALVIGGAIGFFAGRSTCPAAEKISEKKKTEKPIAEKSTDEKESQPDSAIAQTGSETEENDGTSTMPSKEEREAAVPQKIETLPIKNICYTGEAAVSEDLTLFAEKTENAQLMYDNQNPEKLQDCSGIFHRVVQHVRGTCDGYKYPEPKEARDSRSLAGWFHENKNFIVVTDAVAQRNLIRPGAVMFFGRSGKKYNDLNIDNLKGGIIFHIGVVTEVTKDENGDVTGYVMFHGRRPGKHAQRSHYHQIAPPRAGFPPLGNWNQQWVGIAYIMTPV